MNIHDFLKSLSMKERRKIAEQCGISLQYVHQIANRINSPSADVATRIYKSRTNRTFNPKDMAFGLEDYNAYMKAVREAKVNRA